MTTEIDRIDLDNAGSEFYSELDRLTNALNAIAQLDPRHDSEDGWNEWGCATCFHKAQVIANEALRAVK